MGDNIVPKYTQEDINRWDKIIEEDSSIPSFIKRPKTNGRELCRICMWIGEQLITKANYTVKEVKVTGRAFAMKHILKISKPSLIWTHAEEFVLEICNNITIESSNIQGLSNNESSCKDSDK